MKIFIFIVLGLVAYFLLNLFLERSNPPKIKTEERPRVPFSIGEFSVQLIAVLGFLVLVVIVIAVMLHNGSCQVDGDYSSCYP